MTKNQKRLGRGLSSLISTDFSEVPDVSTVTGPTQRATTHREISVPVERIKRNPYQPRTQFDDPGMEDLARSVRQTGIIQPLIARPAGDGWELIAGERRLRAAIQAGLDEVPVIARSASDEEVLELALIENIHREDLNAIERAKAYKKYAQEFRLPIEEIARRVGEDRSTVTNYIRLLELGEEVQGLVAGRALSMGHARCLLGIPDEDERRDLAEAVVRNELSVRALEEIVRRRKKRGSRAPARSEGRDQGRPLVQAIQERLIRRLGLKIRIQERRKANTGRIIIEYQSLDDFNKITGVLGLEGE